MRKGLNHWSDSGATDGQVPVWDEAAREWKPGDVGAASTVLVPWTTTLSDGTPALMWDDDDNLMMVEVPLR